MTSQYFKLHSNGKLCKVVETESNLIGGRGFDVLAKIVEPDHAGIEGWNYEMWVAVCRGEFVEAPTANDKEEAHKTSGNNQAKKETIMDKQAVFDEFVKHAARAFFASAWADQGEESGNAQGGEIMDRIPEEIDPAAIHAARTLAMDIERKNRRTIAQLMELVENMGCGDRPATVEYFAHYCAMQAMGHGVWLNDAFGGIVANVIRVPYVDFGGYSLERDYF